MIDLSKFYNVNAIVGDMRRPWSSGDYTYATDGKIGIRVARRPDVVDEVGPDLQRIMDTQPAATNLRALSAFTPPDKETCPECEGLSCEECEGGKVERSGAVVQLGERLWLNAYLFAKISELPGARLDISDQSGRSFNDGRPCRFEFDGGDGLVMPMRASAANHTIHVIDLREKVAE